MSPRFPSERPRVPIRLPGYDYTWSGSYFVTISTFHRACLFGEVRHRRMVLSDAGRIAAGAWRAIPDHFPGVRLDAWVIMPNHVHGIILLPETHQPPITIALAAWRAAHPFSKARPRPYKSAVAPVRGSLSVVIGSFKSATTRQVNLARQTPAPVWHSSYYERIIGNPRMLAFVRRYIQANPWHWKERPR